MAYLPVPSAPSPISQEIILFQDLLGVQFSLSHVTNTGAAWGIFKHFPHLLITLRVGFLLTLALYLYLYRARITGAKGVALSLLAGGALGNILDYFLYGHVVDMLHFVIFGYDFPVFNIADSAIAAAVFLLLFF